MARGRRASSASQACVVCCLNIDNKTRFQTVGSCNHLGCCSICALRMRQLLKSKHCVMCKTEMDRVICITDDAMTFESFQDWGDNIGPSHTFDEASGMYFLKENYSAVQGLRSLTCSARACPDKHSFPNIKALKQHLNTKHALSYCDICLDHKHVFLEEQELYTASALKKHKTQGNPEHGFNGHPKCNFCASSYYGNNELHEHLRKNHFECEICLHAYGIENRYYKDYNDMEKHFRSEHFLCEVPSCLEAKFVVFKNHIEFQAHMTNKHPHIPVSKRIDVNFSVRRADREGRDEYKPRDDYTPLSVASDAASITVADFPALVGNADTLNFTPWQSQSIRIPRQEDFPQLASSTSAASSSSLYRNAIAPQPTLAMRAHMHGSDPWEYPEMQQAAEVLGANNPFLRLVKPTKKKKNKAAATPSPSPPPTPAAAAAPPVDEDEEKPAVRAYISTDESPQESVIESIQAALGSEAKYVQFREVCKKFRQKEIPAVSFYSLARAMFRPQDLHELFPKLMSLLPDESQVTEVLVLHNNSKPVGYHDTKLRKRPSKVTAETATSPPAAAAATSSAPKPSYANPAASTNAQSAPQPAARAKSAAEDWPAPELAPKPAQSTKPKKARQVPIPAAVGWGNALKEVGAVPKYSKNGHQMNVVLNNTDRDAFNARARNKKTKATPDNVVGWSSAASWSEPVSAPIVSGGYTPESSKIQIVSAESVQGSLHDLQLQTQGKVPSRTRSDFPELPKAAPAIGIQHVQLLGKKPGMSVAAWGEDDPNHQTQQSTPQQASKKKNKKGKLTLAEFAMLSG
ncbi:hypothetical protein B5M09_000904 [Aphanomyces astaci]|uniref:C2H2-type domain-containing protein n=1 Tax=Aphanomyces astaci TaxID=112090 RepID=A0A3R7WH25_APHAT|nr:hypothetical protein B5M09_000904 [Aphanomyces astaci]